MTKRVDLYKSIKSFIKKTTRTFSFYFFPLRDYYKEKGVTGVTGDFITLGIRVIP